MASYSHLCTIFIKQYNGTDILQPGNK